MDFQCAVTGMLQGKPCANVLLYGWKYVFRVDFLEMGMVGQMISACVVLLGILKYPSKGVLQTFIPTSNV